MVLDIFCSGFCGRGVMLKNVLTLALLFLAAPVLGQGYHDYGPSCTTGVCNTHAASPYKSVLSAPYGNSPWATNNCGSATAYYVCRVYDVNPCTPPKILGTNGQCVDPPPPTCTPPQVLNTQTNQCETPPPDCSSQLPGSAWNGEACTCPAGTTQGYSGTVSGGLQQSCISQNPQEGCPAGSYQIQVGGVDQCWTPEPENPCPEGSYAVTLEGVEQCWTPDEGQANCPEGTYYVEINNVGQCYNPEPNIEDPGSSSSTSSGGSASSSTSSSGAAGSGFDDSNIVARLDQLKNKADSTNTKLDEANEHLEGIKDILEGEGVQPMPGHSQASVGTFGEVNTAFYSRVSSAPVVQAFSNMADLVSLAGAECPEFSIEFPEPIDTTASTDLHCSLYAVAAPYLSAVMMVVWSWAAFRVFGSA